MSESSIQIRGKLTGAFQVQEMMVIAPRRIAAAIRRRLYVERNRFVGSRKGRRSGTFTRSVLRRRRRGRPGTMPMSVAGMFRGHLKVPKGSENASGMVLRMGMLQASDSPFVKGIIQLQKGYTRTSSKWMPMPVYDNLEKIGITKAYTRRFHELAAADELIPYRTGSEMLWLSRDLIDEGADIFEATLWIGVRSITVRALPFRFHEQWNRRLPGVIKRLRNAIDREVRAVERGFVRAR